MRTRVNLLGKNIFDRRRSLVFGLYACLVAISYASAYLLRFDFGIPAEHAALLLWSVAPLALIRLVAFRALRLTRERFRYVSTNDVLRLAAGTALGSFVLVALDLILPLTPRVPLSVLAIEMMLTCGSVAAVWISYRVAFEHHRKRNGPDQTRRVLIIGAGEAGNLLAREMRRVATGYLPVGFIDDDPTMWGASLHGLEVMGATRELAALAMYCAVDELIIAVPSANPAALRRIVGLCEETKLPFKVLPGIEQVLKGEVGVNQLREVRIEDLLGREPVQLRLQEIAADMADCVVLITGAAGSIGSELSRQVALHNPRAIVILDQAETPLFFLEIELRELNPELMIYPVICDVADPAGIDQVFDRFRPDRVFHAAAYKHVPMMELNPREAIRNNVVGTWRVADAAGRYGADRFVLVSTDKAVRPSSIMGATKRLAEIITLELQEQYKRTAYGAVRFGNVLGSAGSVIPVFRRQIEKGMPLTITHPDVTRFFMTIPEASQLILQSSLMDEFRGHIAMLEMGEPVRIVDLAVNLLRLSGHTGDLSAHIAFTGLRPGEKMHEELIAPEEETVATPRERVRVIRTFAMARSVVGQMKTWEELLADSQVDQVIDAMQAIIPTLPMRNATDQRRKLSNISA